MSLAPNMKETKIAKCYSNSIMFLFLPLSLPPIIIYFCCLCIFKIFFEDFSSIHKQLLLHIRWGQFSRKFVRNCDTKKMKGLILGYNSKKQTDHFFLLPPPHPKIISSVSLYFFPNLVEHYIISLGHKSKYCYTVIDRFCD